MMEIASDDECQGGQALLSPRALAAALVPHRVASVWRYCVNNRRWLELVDEKNAVLCLQCLRLWNTSADHAV